MATPVSDSLVGLTPAERVAAKNSAYGALPTPQNNLTAGSRIVSIVEGPVVENGRVKVTLALWIDSGVGMELIDLGDANPFYFVNPPILVPDPAGDVVRSFTDPHTQVVTETRFREDLEAALMQMAYDATERFTGGGGVM